MPATKTAAKKAAKPAKPVKVAKPSWKDLPDAELAAHLLDRVTIPDSAWEARSNGLSREKGEARSTFIARCLLPEVETEEAA